MIFAITQNRVTATAKVPRELPRPLCNFVTRSHHVSHLIRSIKYVIILINSHRLSGSHAEIVIVIVISKLLKRYSKAKRTSLFTSAATNQRGVSKGGQEKLRSDFQSTRRGQSSC